jgi:hypothetical protein
MKHVIQQHMKRVRYLPFLFAALVSLGVITSAAQEPGPPPPLPESGNVIFMRSPGGEPGDGKVVTGNPLTAQITVTRDTTLADGNKIHHVSETTLYRDSQGRVRREMTVDVGTPATAGVKHTIITINDPVSGHRYTLDPANKTARELPGRKGHGGGPEHSHGPGLGPEAGPGPHPDGLGDGLKQLLSKDVQQQQLGTKTIAGYESEGRRVTRTIAAGEIGNEKPIEVVTERWFSKDLQLPVLVVHTDPMMGTVTTKLTTVTKGDPDASLFQVPDDYKVVSGRPGDPFYVPLHP